MRKSHAVLSAAVTALLAAQASAVTLAPAVYREVISLSCTDGGTFAGADDLSPEAINAGGTDWSGSAETTVSPRVSAALTVGAVTGCATGVFHRSFADVTYQLAVIALPGAPAVSVNVLIPGVGEATGPNAGLIGLLDFRWDGITFSGNQLVSRTTGSGGTVSLNHTFALLLSADAVVQVTLRATCDYRGLPGSCSAFLDPLAHIDPTQTVLVGGVSHPITDFFTLQFSANLVPEPAASALLAIGAGCLLYARARRRPGRSAGH
jgi:hypothetical protein